MKIVSVVVAASIVIMISTVAQAVPSLGVGSDYGYVNGSDPYQTYWSGAASGRSGQDGFVIGPSGSNLHVWSNIANADIYILTTGDVYAENSIRFNDGISEYASPDSSGSDSPASYYGINLGKVSDAWAKLDGTVFNPGQFYVLDIQVSYSRIIGPDQWIFAAADTNGLAGLQASDVDVWIDDTGQETIQKKGGKTGSTGHWAHFAADTFSYAGSYGSDDPSSITTSARGWKVPEPSSLWLIGMGLAGLGMARRKISA